MTDLMLVEALKIFFPGAYKLAAFNGKVLTEFLETGYYTVEQKQQEFNELFGEDAGKLGNAKALFRVLFPAIVKIYPVHRGPSFNRDSRTEDDLHRAKSIASAYYFKRYFSYAVQDGEIPDSAFNELLAALHEQNIDAAHTIAKTIIERSSDEEFVRRLEIGQPDVQAADAISYCQLLVRLSPSLSLQVVGERLMNVARVPGLLLSYIELIPETDRIRLCEFILRESTIPLSYNFLHTLFLVIDQEGINNLRNTHTFFTADRYQQLSRIFIDRALQDIGSQALYRFYEVGTTFVFMSWQTAYGNAQPDKYLKEILQQDAKELLVFLRYMAPYSSSNEGFIYRKLTISSYDLIAAIFDIEHLYGIAVELAKEAGTPPAIKSRHEDVTDIGRLHGFIRLHDRTPPAPPTDSATLAEEIIPEY
jgi:hypothetical protein